MFYVQMVESLDIFPTLLELTGTPPLPRCQGVDQPPTINCLQGESYASEFLQPSSAAASAAAPPPPPRKQFAFSQWPFAISYANPFDPKSPGGSPPSPNVSGLREGYTVRSSVGYRYTL